VGRRERERERRKKEREKRRESEKEAGEELPAGGSARTRACGVCERRGVQQGKKKQVT